VLGIQHNLQVDGLGSVHGWWGAVPARRRWRETRHTPILMCRCCRHSIAEAHPHCAFSLSPGARVSAVPHPDLVGIDAFP
jgi:hypothetical protein